MASNISIFLFISSQSTWFSETTDGSQGEGLGWTHLGCNGGKAGWWQILALRWRRTTRRPDDHHLSCSTLMPQPHTLPLRSSRRRTRRTPFHRACSARPGLGLPRNVGLPAPRSFPGNRQEAWPRVGLPAAGSRVGRAGRRGDRGKRGIAAAPFLCLSCAPERAHTAG